MMFLAAGAVSCSKEEPARESLTKLEITPLSAQTKASVSSGPLPSDYTIYLSSFFNNETSHKASGNYLTGEPFRRKEEGSWSASPVVYWPLGGSLDFLALATKDMDVRENATWYEDNVSRSVELKVPDGSCLDSEIMYACATSRKMDGGSVPLQFSHTQSWLQFEVASYLPGTTMIDSIVVSKTYLGGTLRIENGVFLSKDWDYRGYFRKDYTVPGSRSLVLDDSVGTFDLLLPEQDACDIVIYFRQKAEEQTDWEKSLRRTSYTVKANPDPWFAGMRTVYTMIILRSMSVQVSVHGWEDNDKSITID